MHVIILLGLAAAVAWGMSQGGGGDVKTGPKPTPKPTSIWVDPKVRKALETFWFGRIMQGQTVSRSEVQRHYNMAKKYGRTYAELLDSLGRILRQLKNTGMNKYQLVR